MGRKAPKMYTTTQNIWVVKMIKCFWKLHLFEIEIFCIDLLPRGPVIGWTAKANS